MKPATFATAAALRDWLRLHHETASELTITFFNKASGRSGLTYAEALDEALCHGWIDGVRKRLDENRYTIRFSPRRDGSVWSQVNVRHAERLIREKRMQPPGLKAFKARQAARTGVYSFENKPTALTPEFEARLRANPAAHTFVNALPPGFRRTVLWWILSAKQTATQERRLDILIAESAAGRRLDLLKPQGAGQSAKSRTD